MWLVDGLASTFGPQEKTGAWYLLLLVLTPGWDVAEFLRPQDGMGQLRPALSRGRRRLGPLLLRGFYILALGGQQMEARRAN